MEQNLPLELSDITIVKTLELEWPSGRTTRVQMKQRSLLIFIRQSFHSLGISRADRGPLVQCSVGVSLPSKYKYTCRYIISTCNPVGLSYSDLGGKVNKPVTHSLMSVVVR